MDRTAREKMHLLASVCVLILIRGGDCRVSTSVYGWDTPETCPKMHFSLRLARLLLVSAVFCVGKRSISPACRSVHRCPCIEATFRAFQWALNWALIVFESFLRSLFRRWGEVGAWSVPWLQQTHQARAEYDGESAREFRSCLRATDQRGERIFRKLKSPWAECDRVGLNNKYNCK